MSTEQRIQEVARERATKRARDYQRGNPQPMSEGDVADVADSYLEEELEAVTREAELGLLDQRFEEQAALDDVATAAELVANVSRTIEELARDELGERSAPELRAIIGELEDRQLDEIPTLVLQLAREVLEERLASWRSPVDEARDEAGDRALATERDS